jgi:hypothetical protein
MDGAPSEGCSTTTILAQHSIEPDAGAGAVHTIMFMTASSYLAGPGFVGVREVMRRAFDEL